MHAPNASCKSIPSAQERSTFSNSSEIVRLFFLAGSISVVPSVVGLASDGAFAGSPFIDEFTVESDAVESAGIEGTGF